MARSLDVASAERAGEGTIRAISDAGRAQVPAPRFGGGGTVIYVSVAVLTLLASCGGEAAEVPPQTSRPGPSDHALEAARTAMTTADPAPIVATFTDDVQLHSPALISPDYRGRPVVGSIVAAALQALEDVRVTDVMRSADGTTGGLVFDARVRGLSAQGFVLLRTQGDRVREITLLLRPLPALRAFVERMGELGAQPALDAGEEPPG